MDQVKLYTCNHPNEHYDMLSNKNVGFSQGSCRMLPSVPNRAVMCSTVHLLHLCFVSKCQQQKRQLSCDLHQRPF